MFHQLIKTRQPVEWLFSDELRPRGGSSLTHVSCPSFPPTFSGFSPGRADTPIAVRVWRAETLTLHIAMPLWRRAERESKETLCREVNGPASTKGVLWSRRTRAGIFGAQLGCSSAASARQEVNLACCITQYSSLHPLDQSWPHFTSKSGIPRVWFHRSGFLRCPGGGGWMRWSYRCCRCLEWELTETRFLFLPVVTGLVF